MKKIAQYLDMNKIKHNIGDHIFNHIVSLNEAELKKQLKDLKEELKRVETHEKKDNRYYKLKDEESLIESRLKKS